MNSMQMYELARDTVAKFVGVAADDPVKPDVLWVGGVLEIRRAVVWYGEKMFMVTHNTSTGETTIDTYARENEPEKE